MKNIIKKQLKTLNKWIETNFASYKKNYFSDRGVFSPSKYYASLLHLYSKKIISTEEIAKMSQTTYGTLRVWRTEAAFKSQIENNINSYADYFIETFHGLNSDREKLLLEFISYSYELQHVILLKEMRNASDQINSIRGEKSFVQSTITAINSTSNLILLATAATKAFREQGYFIDAHLMSWLQVKLLNDIRGIMFSIVLGDLKNNKIPDETQLEILKAYDKSITITIEDAMGNNNFSHPEVAVE